MTYMGRMQNGKVVFDGEEKPLDGTTVRVDVVEENVDDSSLSKALLKLAGSVEGLPPDASINIDHYLYGLPKK
jgi:hypothetical protein